MECNRLFQQTICSTDVHCIDTRQVHETMGSRHRTFHHSVEHLQYPYQLLNLPTTCEELGSDRPRNMWKSTRFLLLHGHCEYRHRYRPHYSADALSIRPTNVDAEEALGHVHVQHWDHVSNHCHPERRILGANEGLNRTWIITIYRQTLLVGLDFGDMAYAGVLATLLSGLEPSVAIALACVPLIRPLMCSRSPKRNDSRYDYGTSRNSQLYSSRNKREKSRQLDTLEDDSSEVQLQPVDAVQTVTYPTGKSKGPSGYTIVVEKKWEVRLNSR